MGAVETLSANIRRLRHARHWSQEDLAEHSGLHRTYISGLERGARNPTLAVLECIADAFSTDVPDLFRP